MREVWAAQSVVAQRERVLKALEATSHTRWCAQRGLPVRPHQREAAFNALADAGVFNRAHPDAPISLPV